MCLVACLAAGGLGLIFTRPAVGGWYAALNKPSFNPPNWVFGPVWTVLYVLMAIAVWMVWRVRKSRPVCLALGLFGVQLVLNAAWSLIFFGLHAPLAAMLELALLWVAVALTLVVFWRTARPAGVLLLPYMAWVSFAAVLSAAIAVLN